MHELTHVGIAMLNHQFYFNFLAFCFVVLFYYPFLQNFFTFLFCYFVSVAFLVSSDFNENKCNSWGLIMYVHIIVLFVLLQKFLQLSKKNFYALPSLHVRTARLSYSGECSLLPTCLFMFTCIKIIIIRFVRIQRSAAHV